MPISTIIKKASSYILGYGDYNNENVSPNSHYEDNEILFCKNNVCVHPPAMARQDYDIIHHPGYLTITTKTFVDQYNDVKRPTLFLNWIPNSTLRKCPNTLENSTDILKQNGHEKTNYFTDVDSTKYHQHIRQNSVESIASSESRSLDTPKNCTNPFLADYDSQSLRNRSEDLTSNVSDCSRSISPDEIKDENSDLRININVEIANPQIEIITTPDSVKDVTESYQQKMFTFSRSESIVSYDEQPWMSTPELLALQHNLTFPDSVTASPVLNYSSRYQHKCRRFSVDLSQMRSLRLFFSDSSCTCGQLVVASRESQYKILHFHHGGLDHLAQVLHQWHSLLHNIKLTKGGEDNLPYRHFMVCRPEVTVQELHPEEGQVPRLTAEAFRNLLNENGQLEDDLALRRSVFFGGIERGLRSTVWPFLLHVYPYQSTYEERIQISEIRRQEYEEITRRRLHEMTDAEREKFCRTIQCVVEKDVIRTDRGNPYFAGEGNPNIETMKNILLNYAFYNPGLGYTQGMSDLLAPVLCEIGDEAATFWCFVGLMQRAVFVATPTDNDMERNLKYLRELIRIMVPRFYAHLEKHEDALELLFCHRWILLCFKREFPEAVALQMWEACWANYLTDYFHLFLCLAIICVYADDVIAQDLRADEMLLHFSSLAMYMEGHVIMRKARGLLYQYRQRTRIPCTLKALCTRCGPGQWDSTHSPVVECVGTDDCPCQNDIDD